MAHLINKLQFEVACPDEEQAFNFRENFGITFQEAISEVVDQVCSQYVNDEQWIQIDKLEIELGSFSPRAFDINFSEIFREKFEKELIRQLSRFSPAQKKASGKLSRIELFRHFLQRGVLPWWADETQIDLGEISVDVLLNEPEAMKYFFYRNRFIENVWQRIYLQLNSRGKALVVLLFDELIQTKEVIIGWVQQLNLVANHTENSELDTTIFKARILEETIVDIVLKNAPQIIWSVEDKSILFEIFAQCILKSSPGNGSRLKQILEENKSGFFPDNKEKGNKIKESQPAENFKTNLDSNEEELIDKYVVKHAGIILLAPFLKSFFTNLKLLNIVEWKNKEAQYEAVHLLKYLSSGLQKTPEYNLTLEKIICGLAIEEPLPAEILLNEKETHEAQLLLESVIEHWKSLKNTSVNGLREAFLKRDGLIKRQEQGWLLQVERKTLDILIDSIPWGYSTINLPWNDYAIFVEW